MPLELLERSPPEHNIEIDFYASFRAGIEAILDKFVKCDDVRAYELRTKLEDSARYQQLLDYHHSTLEAVRLPLRGYVAQDCSAEGHWPDGWLRRECRFAVRAERPVAAQDSMS